jgi:hypothetical protein
MKMWDKGHKINQIKFLNKKDISFSLWPQRALTIDADQWSCGENLSGFITSSK